MSDHGHTSSGDEDGDEEPILKYSRFEGVLSTILAEDSISSFVLCNTTIVLGSHNGVVYVLTLTGSEIRRYRAHSAAVASVSIDKLGTTVVSAGVDGRIIIYNIVKKETSMYDFKRPLRAVALDPEYHLNSRGRMICGGLAGKLTLLEKGWVGNKETVLSSNLGPITEISWHGNLVAWSNDQGVLVYDLSNMRTVGSIDRRPNAPRADLFKCRLLWQNSDTLFIGWFDHITKVSVQEGIGKILNIDVTFVMKIDSVVSGMAMFGENLLMMAFPADLQEIQSPTAKRGESARPEIRIINPKFEEISEDALGLRDYTALQPNDYSLFTHSTDKSFFIISPKDIVLACERDAKDHIQWLLETERYAAALAASQNQAGLPMELSYGEIGRQYMNYLQKNQNYEEIAKMAQRILVEDVEAWEKLILLFIEKDHLAIITPYIPVENPTLGSKVYEMSLNQFLEKDLEMFLYTVEKWPTEIYNVDQVVDATEHKLVRDSHNVMLKKALAELFLKTDRPRDALPYYLSLGKPETLELIQNSNLFDAVQDSVLELVLLDVQTRKAGSTPLDLSNQQAIKMLVKHSHSIPMAKVVAQLEDRPALLYAYFRTMLNHDSSLAAEYSDLQITLYAEYDREKLMELLKTTNTYSLENAAKICEQRDYIPELVFILGKTGNNKKALKLIIEKLGDVKQAIAFAYSQADSELWEDLIRYSLDKPAFIRGLLENAGSAIDPISLIRRIPHGLVIEGLKDSLTKIFSDLDLQLSLSQCGSQIHKSDISALALQLRAGQRRGISLNCESERDDAEFYIFFDGRRVTKKELGLDEGRIDVTPATRIGSRRAKRQLTAGKITDSAIHKTKIMAYIKNKAP